MNNGIKESMAFLVDNPGWVPLRVYEEDGGRNVGMTQGAGTVWFQRASIPRIIEVLQKFYGKAK